jgi:two-component system OmpR family response regulator
MADMSAGFRILVVEDDPTLARELLRHLERAGWVADHVSRFSHAVEALVNTHYRMVLLDRRLPDGDGIALAPVAKSLASPPTVLFLTARDEVSDRVEGLDAGADDYLVKPFAIDELLARVRAAARRPSSLPATPAIEVANLHYEPQSRELRIGGAPTTLPRRELVVLDALMARAGRVVQRAHIEEAVYGYRDDVSSNALETSVSRLRRRLQEAGASVEIATIRGVGYLLRAC